MKKSLLLFIVFLLIKINISFACTNILVSKGASADGSVIITYSCDGEFHPILEYKPAADYQPGDSLEITSWGGKIIGKIHQVPHTYAHVGLINEHQLAIGETTFDGRLELRNPDGLLSYFRLMELALERTKTARDAIKTIIALAEQYGYRSTGESISISDTKEAWILEMIGSGPGSNKVIWVAVRVPDGYISAHANKARIGEFPLKDPNNCMYAANVISFAVEKGYYDLNSGKPFNFAEAYCPSTPKNRRYADTRVWSIFRRAAPSKNLSADYNRAVDNAVPYPLFIKPDQKLSTADVMGLMRDHYEGTAFDMTKGIDAGPFGSPNRWRPIYWKEDDVEYSWERPVSTQQTGFSFVSQSRSWLPDPIGGVMWYGVDDTYTTCYTPLYCGIDAIPESFANGNIRKFSWDSAWWVFNFVANFANLKYSYMIQDIQAVQKEIEGTYFKMQPSVEKTALDLQKQDPELAKEYLTGYSVSQGESMVRQWKTLGENLICKYNDGYVKDENGRPREVGYPESWLKKVTGERPEQFKLKENIKETPESQLVD
jgi:dipeptidase